MTVNEDGNVLTAKTLNNFLVSMRESVRQARVHLIHHHTRRIKALTKQNRTKDVTTIQATHVTLQNSKNKHKALKLAKEIKSMKCFSDGDLGKLVLLNRKSFSQAARDGSSAGYRAVCRLAEHAAVTQQGQAFSEKFGDTTNNLPYCIKVLGMQKRYKKIRKLAQKGKKDKFMETQRFCFRLLQEIGGSEFAAAEDLYKKLQKNKKKDKIKLYESSDPRTKDADGQSCSDSDVEESSGGEEETSQEQLQLRDKIFKKLDAVVGVWHDDGSDDSELENLDIKKMSVTVKGTGKQLENMQKNASSKKELLYSVESTSKSKSNPSKVNMKAILLKKRESKSSSTKNTVELCSQSVGEVTGDKEKIFVATNQVNKISPQLLTNKEDIKSGISSTTVNSAFFSNYAAKQIDLGKTNNDNNILLTSPKYHTNLNLEDELLELPKRFANKRRRLQEQQNCPEIISERSEPKLLVNDDDDDDFDPNEFNAMFNAKIKGEALLLESDVRKARAATERGGSSSTRGYRRGGSRGGYEQSRDISDRRRGGSDWSRGSDRSKRSDVSRGVSGRGNSRSDRSKGVSGSGSSRSDRSKVVSDRGSSRSDRSRCISQAVRGFTRGRLGGGRGHSQTGRDNIRWGRDKACPSRDLNNSKPGPNNRASCSRVCHKIGSDENLHPSWAAKRQQTVSITAFQGKKITFE